MGWELLHSGSVLSLLIERKGVGRTEENHDLPGTLPAGKQPQTPTKSMSVIKSLKPEARGEH